jgi:HEAT repeat protein
MTLRIAMKSMALLTLSVGLFAMLGSDVILAASKAAEAKKAIAELAAAKDSKVKATALDELGKIAQVQKALVQPALSDIKAALKDKDATVRAAAAQCYGRCDPDPKEALPILEKMLKDDVEEVKFGVASGLAAMGPNAYDARATVAQAIKVEKSKAKDGKQTKLSRALGDTIKSIAEKKKKN